MYYRINLEHAKSVIFLTATLIMITVWGVIAADWTKGMNMLTFVGFGAILIGIMLARSVLPALVAHIFSIIIGIGWAFWVTTRLLPSSYTWFERWENLAMRQVRFLTGAVRTGGCARTPVPLSPILNSRFAILAVA